jgi:hypothetical protein
MTYYLVALVDGLQGPLEPGDEVDDAVEIHWARYLELQLLEVAKV